MKVSWDYVFFPIYGKITNVPNHKPDINLSWFPGNDKSYISVN
jgi:hypothetical protein